MEEVLFWGDVAQLKKKKHPVEWHGIQTAWRERPGRNLSIGGWEAGKWEAGGEAQSRSPSVTPLIPLLTL